MNVTPLSQTMQKKLLKNNEELRQMTTTPKVEQQQYGRNLARTKSPNTVRFQLTEHRKQSDDLEQFDKLAQQQLRQFPTNSTLQNVNHKNNCDSLFNGSLLLDSPSNIATTAKPNPTDVMDGGESTTSSTTSSTMLDDSIISTQQKNNLKKENRNTNRTISSMKNILEHKKSNEIHNLLNHISSGNIPSGTVYEEDDLLSVISEPVDSLFGVCFFF